MENIYRFSEIEMLGFLLVVLRLGTFLVAWPIFGSESMPLVVKALLALTLAFIVFPIVGWSKLEVGLGSSQIVILAAKEVFLGLVLGFFCRLMFFAIHMGGQIIGISMGLNSGQLFNPSLGGEGNAIEQFKIILGSVFFLFINGHHLFLTGIVKSFDLIPVHRTELSFTSFGSLGIFLAEIFAIAIRIGAPVMISVLFMNIAMGLAGRAVPQINVLITSMPVNILVGLLTMIVALPLFATEIGQVFELLTLRVFQFMRSL